MTVDVKVKYSERLQELGKEIKYATEGSAGIDLVAATVTPVIIAPGCWVSIPTGISIELDANDKAAFIFPRSGLASKYGINLINCVGVVDSDYRGEILVPLMNNSNREFLVKPGDRIAQLVILPVHIARIVAVETLGNTVRGSGGFGSTGI